MVELKHAYDDHSVSSLVTGLVCADQSLCVVSSQEESDINTIVRRFGLTGELPTDLAVPQFGDFSELVVDYHSAMNLVAQANEAFMELPAEVRARFGNDPQSLVAFVSDDANAGEMEKLGLAVPKAPEPVNEVVEALDRMAAKLDPAGSQA